LYVCASAPDVGRHPEMDAAIALEKLIAFRGVGVKQAKTG
jgi:hypothetical protein